MSYICSIYLVSFPANLPISTLDVTIAKMSVPEYVRRKYSTMFIAHPPFAYEHADDSILARLRCDLPSAMPYKEQPIHSCAAERTRRLSLPAIGRVAIDQVPGSSRQTFPPPRRSLTAPNDTVHGDGETHLHQPFDCQLRDPPERIASDWPDSPDLVSDHEDWTLVEEPIEALTPTDKFTDKPGANRCPRCKTNIPRYFPNQASQGGDHHSHQLCTCSDTKKLQLQQQQQQQRRRVDYSEPVQVLRGAW